VTSTTETCPTCRMVAEKFTIYPLRMGTHNSTLAVEPRKRIVC
jgi:hypothetical protein